MQTITAAQQALLVGDRLEVSAGLEVLDLTLTVVSDISDYLQSGSVKRNMDARIHGTCRLGLSAELSWGAVLVRPYMTLSDGGVSSRFNCGVFMLTTPEEPVGELPATFSAAGADRLYLLDREVGDDYTVTAGTTYYAALVAVFAAAGLTGYSIDGSAADYTLPADRTWSLVGSSTDPDQTSSPKTWLRIVNDLLTAINFRGVWADENGLFRCQQYLEPSVRAPEFTFDADDDSVSIVGEQRTLIADMWKAPNRWVFLNTNIAVPVEGAGKYTVLNQSNGPTSIDARGITWTKVYEYDTANQAALVLLGDRTVAADRRVTKLFKVTTGPMPAAGHADVFTYVDTAAGGTFKVIASDWELDLLGGDMSWTWQTI